MNETRFASRQSWKPASLSQIRLFAALCPYGTLSPKDLQSAQVPEKRCGCLYLRILRNFSRLIDVTIPDESGNDLFHLNQNENLFYELPPFVFGCHSVQECLLEDY